MRIDENPDRTVLAVIGPIRLGEVPVWLELAQRAAARALPVDVDLTAAEHMHSAAWQVLCALQREVKAAALSFRMLGMSPAAAANCALLGLADALALEAA